MGFYLSPLVAIKEVDLSTTIPAVATSIGVLVLRDTYKGPELEKTLITSENELVDRFGMPRKRVYEADDTATTISNCYQDMFSAIGYLRYGNKLYCTRVMPPLATFAGTTLNAGGTWTATASGDAYTLNSETMVGDIDDPDEFPDEVTMGTDQVKIIAASRGYWGNSIRITICDQDTYTQMSSGALTGYDTYETIASVDSPISSTKDLLLIVENIPQGSTSWDVVETFNVSLDEDAVDDQGQVKYIESTINETSNYIRIAIGESYKNNDVPSSWVTQTAAQLGGGGDKNSDTVTNATIIEGYELYENAEDIDVNIFIDSNKEISVKRKLVTICEDRLDSMCIIDTLYAHNIKNRGSETTDIRDWRLNTFNENTSYASVYANWLNVYDKYMNEYHWVPASGYVAGIYANTDYVADPWFAPAGLNRAILSGIRKLAWNPTLGQRDILYKNGVNPIVSFAGQGKVIWGQKTMLDKNSAFNRVNVRRLFIVLEKAISTASRYFLFEPNDRFTRAQLKAMIEPYLRDVKSRRGIYEFFVQCDEENNTPERIDRNELWVDIFIQPVRSAEFIVLQFVATKTGAVFSELIGQV